MSSKFSITPIAGIVAAVLASTSWSTNSQAEDAAKEQDKIIITGSRIKRTDVEGASTVVSMTAEEMQQQGFTNLYEALASFSSATGSFVGEQFTRGFQPNAQAINFRGLGPGRTLYLLDGKRIADYPSPYNGESNFVNLSHIPMAMIERVEVMAGGASAIYGSDAMAGVVNIITKKNIDGQTLTARYGDTTGGGASSRRYQWFGGTESKNFSNVFSVEYFNAEALKGSDRPWLTAFDQPTYSLYSYGDGSYIADQSLCDEFGFTYEAGDSFCRSTITGSQTLQNDRERWNIFDRITFMQGDYNELSLEFHLWKQEGKSNSGPLFWQTERPAFIIDNVVDQNFIAGIEFFRTFTDSEIPDTNQYHDEMGADIEVAFKGFTDNFYDYQVSFSHSFMESEDSRTLIKEEEANAFFLGTYVATEPNGQYDIYTGTDFSRLFRQLSAAEIDTITGEDLSKKDSSVTSLSFELSGDLFSLGDEEVQFASIVEMNRKQYEIDLNPRTLNQTGQGWFGYTGTEGEGTRDGYGLGLETLWPITDQLKLTLAGRYDKYDDETNVDDAWTYNIGIEYRPTDALLVRASASTNFRAPDMHLIYANQGGAFYGATIGNRRIFANTAGSLELEEETGKSQTLGVVYEPIDNLSLSVDFYQLELEDLVEFENGVSLVIDAINNCGMDIPAGCSDNVSYQNGVYTVNTRPVNVSYQMQQGVDTSARYTLNTEGLGRWVFTANHTNVIKSERQPFVGAEIDRNWRHSDLNGDLRSRFRSTATWFMGDFRTTLMSNRLGSLNSFSGGERLDSWTTYNMSIGYDVTTDFTVDFIVNNLTKEYPRLEFDRSWPYYNTNHYNALRRSWFIEGRYTF
ncbi:MAG: TonB-dependent receptor [Gammaproteobacteria bacterium]|nr:TonB-dependent receptor [Gammaproteobacteria bacterium]